MIVADDSNVYREILMRAVNETGMADVLFAASDGREAVSWLKLEVADVVLLDVFMPEVDGLEALKIIKRDYPNIDVIMISSNSVHSAELTMEALNNGAIDFILKPTDTDYDKSTEIIKNHLQTLFIQTKNKKLKNSADAVKKTKELESRSISITKVKTNDSVIINKFDKSKLTNLDLILVASSTGGPSALEKVFTGFSSDLNIPVLVVQHMPPKFTRSLSESLNRKCKISVKEGCDNDLVQKGQIIIAPGGYHMVVKHEGANFVIKTETTPYVNGVRPAADILFNSVADIYKNKNILIVVLTGMGSDGKNGVMQLKQKCNCYCITQSEKSCVVYGMPKSVYQAGLSDEVVDLDNISKRIQEIVAGKGI